MYFSLTENIQRRFELELRRYWSYHPRFQNLANHIQGKFSTRERVHEGIIIKNASGNQAHLSADNFQGTVHSYVMVARVEDRPGLAIEWVREDGRAIQRNNGVFPTAPGVYYVQIDQVSDQLDYFTFFIDPLLEVIDETVALANPTTGRLHAGKFLDGTLRLFQMPGNVPLIENVNYTTDPTNGAIFLMNPLPAGSYLSADYRWPATTPEESPAVRPNNEPWTGKPDHGLVEPLPGVVLAFGRRIEPGDTMAVVVYRDRCLSALEYGGKWDLNLDFEVVARDPITQRSVLDQTVSYVWGVLRPRLSTEGIEVQGVSLGGETEEVYDDVGDDYFFTASFSVSLQTDWSMHVPIGAFITRVSEGALGSNGLLLTREQLAALTPEELQQVQSSVQMYLNSTTGLNLQSYQDPFYRPGAFTFERLT